jgi:ATP-binding cassette subfamily F protein uup
MASQQIGVGGSSGTEVRELTPEEKEEDKKKRKRAFNAPKRIQKIEQIIENNEQKMAKIDGEMMEVGNDVGKLTDMSQEKEKLDAEVEELMEEWAELEMLLEELNE